MRNLVSWFKSRAGHVKSGLNTGGPSPKAKYSWLTDSEQVPWGKGEKNPEGGVKDTETEYLQAVRAETVQFMIFVQMVRE